MGIGSSFWLHLPCKQLTRGPVALPGTRGSEPCWCQLWAVLQCSALSPGTGGGVGDPQASGCWHQPVWCTMGHVHGMAARPPPHPVGQKATRGMLCRMEPSCRALWGAPCSTQQLPASAGGWVEVSIPPMCRVRHALPMPLLPSSIARLQALPWSPHSPRLTAAVTLPMSEP